MHTIETEILVIGAGPAGTIAASIATQAGKKVTVVEKQTFPRFVIGESLLPFSMEHFEEAKFLDALQDANFEKKFGALFIKDGIHCRFNFAENFTPGWTWTWQVPRADFDKIMADQVVKMGTPIHYNTEVKDVVFNGTESITTVSNEKETYKIKSQFLIDASGYGRVLPRLFDLDEPSSLPPKHAMFVHSTDSKRPNTWRGPQITFYVVKQDVWLWMIPFSNGNCSIGFVGDPSFFEPFYKENISKEEVFRKLMELEPEMKERFEGESFLWEPKGITNYGISTKTMFGDGFALAGNATEFLDPVFSSGVAFACESGRQAAKLAVRQLNGENVNWKQEYEEHIWQGINTFRSYVDGWYNGDLQTIFFSQNHNPEIKKQICSVLAGYVWDTNNPFVKKHATALKTVVKAIEAGGLK